MTEVQSGLLMLDRVSMPANWDSTLEEDWEPSTLWEENVRGSPVFVGVGVGILRAVGRCPAWVERGVQEGCTVRWFGGCGWVRFEVSDSFTQAS
jgi:hypothetical protein